MKTTVFTSPIRVHKVFLTAVRILIHTVSLVWLFIVLQKGITGSLPGDPVQYLLDFTGIGAMNLLLLSLTVSPLAEHLKFGQIIILRKTFGVYAAFYALSHLAVFIAFELQFEWGLILSEIIERPYISVGFCALLILTALLVTSFDTLRKKMGRTWQKLHRWVYLALILALLHFLWSIKANELQPYVYIGIGVILLLFRKKKIKMMFMSFLNHRAIRSPENKWD
jgi:sulfoxide reductase heme-binding subunit YedZ